MQPYLYPALGDNNAFGTAGPKLPGFKGHSTLPYLPVYMKGSMVECPSVIKVNGREKKYFAS